MRQPDGTLYELDIEKGLPGRVEALHWLRDGLFWANSHIGVRVIHGFSSGEGPRTLKYVVRGELVALEKAGVLARVIFGEDWNIFKKLCRQLLDQHPILHSDRDLNRNNPGVTFAFFSPR